MDRNKVSRYVVVSLILILLYFSIKIVSPYFTYLVIGAVLAYSFYPLYKKLSKLLHSKNLSALVIVLIVLSVLIVPSFFTISYLVKTASNNSVVLNTQVLNKVSEELTSRLGFQIDVTSEVQEGLTKIKSFFISNAGKLVGGATELVIGLFLLFIELFTLFKRGPELIIYLKKSLPLKKEITEGIIKEFKTVTYAVVYSQVLVSLVQGILVGISFIIFGVSNPILWGIVALILSFLPVVGAPLVWIPAGIIKLLEGDIGVGIGLLVFNLIITMNVDDFMRPRIVSHRSRLHPLLTLIGVLGGLKLFGFVGLLLGPLIIALFIVLVQYFNSELVKGKK